MASLGLSGMAGELAKHCALVSFEKGILKLSIDQCNDAMLTENMKGRMQDALQALFDEPLALHIEARTDKPVDTIAARHEDAQQQANTAAHDAIAGDLAVQALIQQFDATVDPSSVTPN